MLVLLLQSLDLIFTRTNTFLGKDTYAQLESVFHCCLLIPTLIPPPPQPQEGNGDSKSSEPWKGALGSSVPPRPKEGRPDSILLSAAADVQNTTSTEGPTGLGAYSEPCQAAPTSAREAGRKERTVLLLQNWCNQAEGAPAGFSLRESCVPP